MRYYFLNQEMEESVFSVEANSVSSDQILSFQCADKSGIVKTAWVKQLAGKRYISFDKTSWSKLPALGANEVLVSNSEVYRVYRGYRPSGLFSGGAGALITQMPGKVVKILVKEGQRVEKGQTILILEAMKMENEIKAGMDGVVKTIHVKEGQALEAGLLMAEIGE